YWKNHLDAWESYTPTDDFDTTFGIDVFDPDITLEDALNLNGGKVNALARHAVAGLLNAAHSDISYCYGTPAGVIGAVQSAIASGEKDVVEAKKDELDECNNYGVPWDD
ncbi:hypothetical protein ACFLXU_02670, partial [Chloroflexota bacterium]